MYSVSAEYISAMNKAIQRHRFSGTISEVPFGMEDVLKDSLTITDQCSDSSDLTLGGVFVGTLKFTLLTDLGFRRGSWKDREIVLDFSMLINETTDDWETVPVGVFTISEVNHSESGIEITAYTAVSKLDIPYSGTTTNGNVYDILKLVCVRCGVELANTKSEVENMPNGNIPLGIYPENNCSTWRDVAHYAAQIVGGFITADRQGRIVLRRFGNATNFSVDTSRRLTGSKFSDFVTNYTQVTVENMTDNTLRVKKLAPDNGITLKLGANPLFQYGTEDTLGTMLSNILTVAHSVAYVPFNSSMVGNPAFDLGDLITYVGGTAGTQSVCCLMSYTWKFGNSYAVKGFGKDPNLANAMSKAEKSAGSGGTGGKGDSLVFLTYENARKLTVGSTKTRIANLKVTNIKETFVDFWTEFKMNVDITASQAILNFSYTLDGLEEVYKPVITINHDGTYTYNLHYWWLLETVMQHAVDVYLSVDGGTVEINTADLHAVLSGQGLATEEAWDGRINITETVELGLEGGLGLPFADGDITCLTAPVDHIAGLSDVFSLSLEGGIGLPFTDSMSIITQTGIFDLITESGDQLITEDGSPYITDGGGN